MKPHKSKRHSNNPTPKSYERQFSKKSGHPPGSLLHVGSKKTDSVTIKVVHYDKNTAEVTSMDVESLCLLDLEQSGIRWIHIEGLDDIETLGTLGDCFDFHPLVMEDILNTMQRPKIEVHGHYSHIVSKSLSYNQTTGLLESEQVSLIMGSNYVMSFAEQPIPIFDPILRRLEDNFGQIRGMGADFLLYTLLDAIVDQYFVVLDDIGEAADFVEQEALSQPSTDSLKAIHLLKRQILYFHKAIWPLREVAASLSRGDTTLITPSTLPYVRDLYDHTIQVMETTEGLRDILNSLVDIYLNNTSNRMNEIMKILTIISTLFIPLTFIVGLYGMNLSHMPEYSYPYSYPIILGVMALISIGMMVFFKRKKWW